MHIRHTLAATLAAGSLLALAPAAATASTTQAPTASSAATACPTDWGSLAKSAGAITTGSVTAYRAGRHACYDRLVVDTTGSTAGYSVGYVSTVTAEGSGKPVPVAGGARLQVTTLKSVTRAPAMPSVAGFTTFRQVAWAGSFEAHTTVGLGVRARLPFRAFTVTDATGSRLVIDVAHTW